LGGGEVIVVLREGVYEDVVEGGRRRSVCVCVYCVYLFFWEGCGGGCCCCGFSSTLVLLGTYDDDQYWGDYIVIRVSVLLQFLVLWVRLKRNK
jgi:hypothetical protein